MKAAEIAKRRKQITELLYQQKEIKVRELVRKFQVSDETIRKDLAYLAAEGVLEKKHGKARLIFEKELAPVFQRTTQFPEKNKLTQAAMSCITSEDYTIGLDQGSTLALLAKKMLSLEEKQIFTSSLAAITQLANGHHNFFVSAVNTLLMIWLFAIVVVRSTRIFSSICVFSAPAGLKIVKVFAPLH